MRSLVLIAALAPSLANADLYRWVDPQAGSVKYSSYPPPWFGDRALELRAPAVEVIVYSPPGAPKPAAGPQKPAATAGMLAALETRLASLTQFFAALPSTTDFSRAGSGIQRQLEAYQALSGLEAQFGTTFAAKPPARK